MEVQITDDSKGYGRVTLALHWGMVALFAWQFVSMGLVHLTGKNALTDILAATHGSVGALVFTVALIRLIWLAVNAYRRPIFSPAIYNVYSTTMHAILYAFMVIVPGVAILWAYGSGNAFAPFGLTIWEAGRPEIPWLVSAGKALHAPLAWSFLAFISLHAVIGLWREHAAKSAAGAHDA